MSPEYRRVVATPRLWEEPPATVQPAASERPWQRVVIRIVRPLWGLRLEILTGVTVLVTWRALAVMIGGAWGGVLLGAVVASGSCSPVVRRVVCRLFHRSRLRRRWLLGVRYAGLATLNDRVPRPTRIRAVPSGDLMQVRVPAGSNVRSLSEASDTVAAYLGVRDVRVARDPANARMATVRVVACDRLSGGPALAWRNLGALRLSAWDAIPVGVDEDGEVVSVTLPEHNVMVGGEPGAGKSVALSMLVATAALDPSVVLWLLDGKMVELAVLKGCAHRWVGPDVEGAVAVLRELIGVCDERLRHLMEAGKRKVEPGDGLALHVVVCDELAYYCRKPRPHGPE
ncbi:MAG: FtsK/SpoIIIE domain-containing protein, partial [Actinomycetota bacterium]